MPKEGRLEEPFAETIKDIEESRILLNYGEVLRCSYMALELGHGFHSECLKGESMLNCDYPMTLQKLPQTFVK